MLLFSGSSVRMASLMLRRTVFIGLLLLGVGVIIAAQFSIPTLFDADGYFHIRMADILRHNGISHHFHWARYSVFAESFADKDFLYHALLIPFTFFSNIFFGAKVAACCFAVAFFVTYLLCLRRYTLSALIPFFAVAFFLSAPFLQVLCKPRPMVLMMLLTLIFTHALIKKRPAVVFVTALCYALTHVSSPLLVLFACCAETVRWIGEREWSWKNIRAAIFGVAIGFVVHPHFPDNFLIFYLNGILVPQFALKWGLELGAEFFPMDTRSFVLGYPVVVLGLIVLVALGTARNSRISSATRIWLTLGGFFLLGGFFSKRYFLHSYSLFLVAAASYVKDWWEGRQVTAGIREKPLIAIAGVIIAVAIVSKMGIETFRQFVQLARSEQAYNGHYEAVASWMNKTIPPGEIIFHANWSDSQFFIGLSPQFDYFVTLDPIYMYYWNKQKYDLYRAIAFGSAPDPYTALKDEFHVRYGYVSKDYFMGLVNRVKGDERFSVLAEDNRGMFFMLK
jgi:hypothetical protein